MEIKINTELKKLADALPFPLYIVGGYVRNALLGVCSSDIDVCAPATIEELLPYLKEFGFTVCAEYKRTQTVKFKGEFSYEFTAFRSEKYEIGGGHTPVETVFTTNITEDAKRRDFKCNAVYYDVKNSELVDPLGGIEDIKSKVLDTVVDADIVFSHDGLRIMRLARFVGELGFKPTEKVLDACRTNAKNLKDISVERIHAELKMIFSSSKKYPFSDKDGAYNGLKILSETGALDVILPELTLGRGMEQRADFHDYDVLEHSLRCVKYAEKFGESSIMFGALLHDIGKPYCMQKFGKYHGHDFQGEFIAGDILRRLKVDGKTANITLFLVKNHMLDIKCDMREEKVRLFIAEHYDYIEYLFMIKQADFSACKDDLSVCPTITKWKKIIENMKAEGVPFSLKELKISAKELMDIGYKGEQIGKELDALYKSAVRLSVANDKNRLIEKALADYSYIR